MALSKLQFTKDWTSKADFPTYESDETQVRADLQCLHNETKIFLNNMIDSLDAGQIPMDISEGTSGDTVKSAVEAIQTQSGSIVHSNVLHNWDFRNPVNQRKGTSYTGIGYTLDRWYSDKAYTKLEINDGYVTLTGENGFGYIRQFLENPLPDETYTISALIRGTGKGMLGLGYYSEGSITGAGTFFNNVGSEWTLVEYTYEYDPKYSTDPVNVVYFQANTGYSYDVKMVKLEKGSKSTLINDIPMEYLSELIKCQRYYLPLDLDCITACGYVKSASRARVMIPTPVQMRNTAQITLTNSGTVYAAGKSGITPETVSVHSTGAVGICADITISDGTVGTPAAWCGFSGYISAEL